MATVYDRSVDAWKDRVERMRGGKIVRKGSEVDWDVNRQGRHKFYLYPNAYGDDPAPEDLPALSDFKVFVQEIHTHSGSHRHQGGLVIYVIEGDGYSIVEGRRIDWKTGDLLLLPVTPGGVEHQHFNKGDEPARWLAFIYTPFQHALGDQLRQVTDKDDVSAG